MLNRTFEKSASWAPLIIRIALGTIFIVHGSQKLFGAFGGPGISGFAGYMGKMGIPVAPALLSLIVAMVEFFGGIFILAGFLTRWAALFISIDMLMAILLVHISKGFFISSGGAEFALANLSMALSLLFTGAGGRWSIDGWRGRHSKER